MRTRHEVSDWQVEGAIADEKVRLQVFIDKDNYLIKFTRSNLEEHFYLVESLRDEAGREGERRSELERDLSSLSSERESLAESLEFSMSRVASLEQRSAEQDKLLREKEQQLDETRDTKLQLLEQLESLSIDTLPSRQGNRLSRKDFRSLLYEIESLPSSADEGSPFIRLVITSLIY